MKTRPTLVVSDCAAQTTQQQTREGVDGDAPQPKTSAWELKYNELKEYYREHGHCHPAYRCKTTSQLGSWVHMQRQQYRLMIQGKKSAMNEERVEQLNELKFSWSAKDEASKNNWDQHFAELKRFIKEHGYCDVPRNCPTNPRLGNWVRTQRHSYRMLQNGNKSNISPEQVALLNGVNFTWSIKKHMKVDPNPSVVGALPINKIKAQIVRDEDVGKIMTTAVNLVGVCSAIFIRDLAHAAAVTKVALDREKEGAQSLSEPPSSKSARKGIHPQTKAFMKHENKDMVRVDHIRECIKKNHDKYDFLADLVHDEITEASLLSSSKKKRSVSKKSTRVYSKKKKKMSVELLPDENPFKESDEDGNKKGSDAVLLQTLISNAASSGVSGPLVEDEDDYD